MRSHWVPPAVARLQPLRTRLRWWYVRLCPIITGAVGDANGTACCLQADKAELQKLYQSFGKAEREFLVAMGLLKPADDASKA